LDVSGAVAINGAMVINTLGQWVGSSTGLQGPAGTNGNTVLNGSGAPSSGLGTNGDFYIDTVAKAIYGPKANGVWGGAVSLIGPTGATGPQGPAGPSVHTSAVCANAGVSSDGDCSCSGHQISKVRSYGSCTITSDTGSCTAYGYNGTPKYMGSCCVCAY
jgi:hypothetical protein